MFRQLQLGPGGSANPAAIREDLRKALDALKSGLAILQVI
jgi:hypothetical protein